MTGGRVRGHRVPADKLERRENLLVYGVSRYVAAIGDSTRDLH